MLKEFCRNTDLIRKKLFDLIYIFASNYIFEEIRIEKDEVKFKVVQNFEDKNLEKDIKGLEETFNDKDTKLNNFEITNWSKLLHFIVKTRRAQLKKKKDS